MTTKKRRTTTRKQARPQTLDEKIREEVFWGFMCLLLLVATVIFVPMIFAPFK